MRLDLVIVSNSDSVPPDANLDPIDMLCCLF